MQLLLYFSLICFCCCGAVLVANLLEQRSFRIPSSRLKRLGGPQDARQHTAANQDALSRWIASFSLWVQSHFNWSQSGALAQRIVCAGYHSPFVRDLYTTTRVLLPALAFFAACWIPEARAFWILSMPALAYLLPDILLERQIRTRRRCIARSTSDMLDLLVICVDAGLGLDQAVLRVAQELGSGHPEMHDELMQINREQRAGVARHEAWSNAVNRIQIPEMEAFVSMLMQADRFGTPITRALSNFAQNTRTKRVQKAEEKAAKTTIKIIFPLVLFIFPSIFIVLLGPAALTLLRTFHN